MKIVCDSCGAKYSISDDKVQGKVFKIRCKKCSNIIVVKGTGGVAAAPASPGGQAQLEKETRVYDYNSGADEPAAPAADDAVWHIVVDQDQFGPLTVDEVRQRFTSGQVDSESYVWREGFGDWLPMSQVDVFAAFIARAGAGGDGDGGGSEAVSSMFGGGDDLGTSRRDEADLFRAKSGGGSALADEEADLFGSPAASASAAGPASGGGGASGSKLRGERNENSVLFSLNNLAALANNPTPRAAQAASGGGGSAGPVPGAAGHGAGGEGSGLIDIRSMANAYMSDKGGLRPAAASSSSIGSIDDLPVFASTSFSEPAVMMPPMGGGRSNNDNRLIYGLIAGVGVLALVMIVLVVKVLGKNDAPAVAVVTQPAAGGGTPSKPAPGPAPTIPATPTDGVKPGTDVAAGSGTPTTPTTVASNDVPPPPDQKPDPVVVAKPDPKRPDPSAKKPDPKKPDSLATKPPVVKPEPTPGPPKPEAGRACDEVSCVLNNYEGSCCAKYKKGSKPTAAPSGDLPASLDRTMVSDGVGKVKGKVMSCGDRSSAKGTVKVSVKVGSDGRVVSASVKESPDPALGNCVASAMQKATFARTQTGGSFAYSFSF